MRVGVPAEVKSGERRVGLLPAGARALAADGHEVLVERGAGEGAGRPDQAYADAGARVVGVDDAWAADLVVKVKEPVAAEHRHLRDDLTLFTYLHLAADRPLTEALLAAGTTAVAYETVVDAAGRLPLLEPMSEIAGRLAVQLAAQHLLSPYGGPGLLVGGAPGVPAARVLVLGGGAVGTQAALAAVGLRADVTVLEVSGARVRELELLLDGRARVLASDPDVLHEQLTRADVVVGAVLVAGDRAPRLITREDLALLPAGAVLVDVAVDQGGCAGTTRPTTWEQQSYVVDGVTHVCVANLPGGAPRTSTRALTTATAPYVRRLAAGVDAALSLDAGLAAGLNTRAGRLQHAGVARAHPDLATAG